MIQDIRALFGVVVLVVDSDGGFNIWNVKDYCSELVCCFIGLWCWGTV